MDIKSVLKFLKSCLGPELKKDLIIVFMLIVEIGLAYVVVNKFNLPESIIALVGAASVYFGKKIVMMITDGGNKVSNI